MNKSQVSKASELFRESLVWDMVFPYEPDEMGNTPELLSRWLHSGFSFISVHPAGDRHNVGEAVRRIARARADILRHSDQYVLVETVDDILLAKQEGKLAVGLHVEGSRLLERDLHMVEAYYQLGIRFCHPVFNLINSFGGGAADKIDIGLTRFGVKVVEEMNRVGMLLDGAHASYSTSMEMMHVSTSPVIFSHVACDAVNRHFRNVRDDQIKACAATGGVLGITGGNNYLGDQPTNETLFRHIDHVVQLVGPEHAGIGLDYVHDTKALDTYVAGRPDEWAGSWMPWRFAEPEQIEGLTEVMLARGYSDASVRGILGENFLRVCRQTWR